MASSVADRRDLGGGAWIALVPGLVGDHDRLLARLRASLPLRSEQITLFGRSVTMPRLTSYHGDPGCAYRYSGRTFEPAPWTDELSAIRRTLRESFDTDFNSVLANLYRGGDDSMGAHADDEPELGPSPSDKRIASVSLGARRRFVLAGRRTRDKHVFELGHGDVLVMGGTTQRRFRHWVPKTKRPVGPRLNLTFRMVVDRLHPAG